MISTLALSLFLAQAAPTQAQVIGALNTISTAWQDRANRTKAFNADRTRVCVAQAAGKTLTGRTTVRFGVLLLEPETQQLLTMPLESGQAAYREQYGAAEVQIDPDLDAGQLLLDLETWNRYFDVIREEVEVRATPLAAAQEVCFIRRDAPEVASASLFRCACRIDATCLVGGSPAPSGVTLAPGTWSGAGCARKPCFARFDGPSVDASWPAACPR